MRRSDWIKLGGISLVHCAMKPHDSISTVKILLQDKLNHLVSYLRETSPCQLYSEIFLFLGSIRRLLKSFFPSDNECITMFFPFTWVGF